MAQLRFAPIIRVSTEKQEKKGESLNTQKTQIKQYVDSIPDGVIPEECWQYSGQESATKKERILWDKLLEDSGKNKFDAIIVCDASRWSRNNQKSLDGLEILRNNKIRFFIGTSEKDLTKPTDRMTLGLFTTMNQFMAEEQALKSIQNRIERARRGIPAVGRLPFGRTYDKQTGKWDVDPEKQALIKQAVKRYINEERLEDISKTVGIHKSFLSKIFKNNLGTEWNLSFVNEKVNIKEKVTITVPALIDDPKLLKEVEERNRSNRLYVRGHRRYTYLLNGYIFCKRCGSKIQGSTNAHGRFRRYYFHFRYRNEKCGFHGMIPATELENSLLIKLVKTLGDPLLFEKALLKATPDVNRKAELEEEQKRLRNNLKKVYERKADAMNLSAEKRLTREEFDNRMDELRSEEKTIGDRLSVIDLELKSLPDPEKVKKMSQFAARMMRHFDKKNPKLIFKKSDEWKRKLIEKAFSGTDISGNRLGVYVDPTDKKGQFIYELHGIFKTAVDTIPMTDEQIIDTFNLDPDNDLYDNLNSIRSNILGV